MNEIECGKLKKLNKEVIIYGGLDSRICKDLYDLLLYKGIKVRYVVSSNQNIKKFQDISVIQDSDLSLIYNDTYVLVFWGREDYERVRSFIDMAVSNFVIIQREVVTLDQLKAYKDLFGNEIIVDSTLNFNNIKIVFQGRDNKIVIDSDALLHDNIKLELHDNAKLEIRNGSEIEGESKIIAYENSNIYIEGAHIGKGCDISARYDSNINIKRNASIAKDSVIFNKYGGKIEIGENATFESGNHLIAESGEIIIGNDLMTSYSVDVICGDGHGIFSLNAGLRKNKDKQIIIGNHVWIGTKSTILGGAKLGNDIIVGANSVVNKDLSCFDNVVIAGNVAKVVSRDVHWERYLI